MNSQKLLPKRLSEIQKQLWAIKKPFSEDLLEILIPVLEEDESITFTFETCYSGALTYRIAKMRFQKGEEYFVSTGCIREPENIHGLTHVEVAYLCSDFARNQALQSLFALRLYITPVETLPKSSLDMVIFVHRIEEAKTYEELKQLAKAMDAYDFTLSETDALMEQLTNRNTILKQG